MTEMTDAQGVHLAQQPQPNLAFGEFITLMALLISLGALSTDAIMPAFSILGPELGRTEPQQLQKIITFFFGGLAIGQLFYGPLSDRIGRKGAIYIGLALFIVGNLLSWQATDFNHFLLGRFMQGFGVAGPRIVSVALVRDLYSGRAMARIMSFVMGLFIFVPVVAPISGQALTFLAGWRSIFFTFILLGSIGGLWLALRQNETLLPAKRIPLTPQALWRGTVTAFTTPSCLGYMIAAGLVMGPFLLYLSTAQNLFQSTYDVGKDFPYYFAGLAISVGIASFANGRLVMRYGMRFLARGAIYGMILFSLIALLVSYPYNFVPAFPLLFVFFCPLFFCIGLLFANMNSLAMQDVGHIAGLASAWIGAISTIIAMTIATLAGLVYDGSILALGSTFVICGSCSLVILYVTENVRVKGA